MGINEIAVPTNTILMVEIIGVTLFFEIVDMKKHKEETVNMTTVDVMKAIKNRIKASSSAKNNKPI